MAVEIRQGFCGKGTVRPATSVSAEGMANGSPICEVRTARRIKVRVARGSRTLRREMTLLDAHEKYRHRPQGIEYHFLP